MAVSTEAFRTEFRARAIGPRYSGGLHFGFVTLTCLAAVGFALAHLRHVTAVELATVPLAFLFANLAEYLGHRRVMHVPRPGLRAVYQRHTLEHHHFFTHDQMACESARDFKIMLFPPVLLLFFLGAIATPLGALCFWLVSPNVGWLFVVTAVGYYLTYEWLHFSYHLPETTWVGRLGVVRRLRQHHQAHHDLSLMGKWNFNITFPICDWIFGTTRSARGLGVAGGEGR